MADGKSPESPTFRPIMAGLAVGSGVFLLQRFLLKLDVEIALPIATFFAVVVGMVMYHWQQSQDEDKQK